MGWQWTSFRPLKVDLDASMFIPRHFGTDETTLIEITTNWKRPTPQK